MSCTAEELADLYAARRALRSGKAVAKVTVDGDTVEYHRGSIRALDAEIADCEATLGMDNGPTAFVVRTSKGL